MDYRSAVGQRFGPGPTLVIDQERVDDFHAALGLPDADHVPLLLVVSLLPALGHGIESPFPAPRLTVNYGLNRVVLLGDVKVGDRLRATFTIADVEELNSALQITRLADVRAQDDRRVAEVETLTWLVF